MQTVFRFSRCGAGFGNKKSPHNNLNLTIPSGMALVRVCYVAIRKSKTCSGSFGSRAGTLSKYVILNCWNRLPQKSSHVNVNLSGQGPSILLRKTVLSLKVPPGDFIAALRFANANFWEHADFGSLQENTRKTLAKRERAGRCRPSWQNYEMLKNFCCFYCGFQK